MVPQSGGFSFFSSDNVEVVAKIINGPEVGTPYWFFMGSLTNVEYEVTVTDLDSGLSRRYSNPQGFISTVVDLAAFDGTSGHAATTARAPLATPRTATGRATATPTNSETGTCVADLRTLCLQNNRFAVTSATHSARFQTSSTGAFVGSHIDILEFALKVVDGRSLNGHFWVFVGALTDQPYEVTILDTVTGVTWTHRNPPGHLESFADISAFPN